MAEENKAKVALVGGYQSKGGFAQAFIGKEVVDETAEIIGA